MGSRIKGIFKESALWMTANVVSTGAALLTTYLAVQLTSGGGTLLASFLAVAGAVSLTWGSWISLSWTRSIPLRAAMKGITLVPGLLLLTAAGTGLYIGLGSLFAWLALVGSAIGTLAVSVLLWQYLPRASAKRSTSNVALGLIAYPFATAGGSAMVGWLWLWFLTDNIYTDWRGLLSFATVMVTILAVELASTVLPAALSMVCCQTSALVEESA